MKMLRQLLYYIPGLAQIIVLVRRRIMKKKKFGLYHLEVVLYKMCLAVGADYEATDFKEDQWFWKYEWSNKRMEGFQGWLKCYLRFKGVVWSLTGTTISWNERRDKVAKEFILNYGWRDKR